MPLLPCPACGRQISTEAEACPQCGHPNKPTFQAVPGPTCYACSAMATTRCHCCGALSCAMHVQNIYVQHGRGGAFELRCQSCYSSAMVWKVIGGVLFVIVLIVVLMVMSGMMR